jgi:hypothetical protein
MSTGDWFTLRPLNINNYQPQIDELFTRLTSLELLTNDINTRLTTVEIKVYNLEQFTDTININLLNLTQQVNAMNQTINNFQTSIDDILNQYKPIMGFTMNVINFTDGSGNTATGNFHGAWYRPIKLLPNIISNDGVDLKFLLLVLRDINISSMINGRYYNSDPMDLPVPFVNNNNFRVFWTSTVNGHEMITRQAHYTLYNVPINSWTLSVLLHQGTSLVNDSAFFIVGYI